MMTATATKTATPQFVVMTAAAKMPSSCKFGEYRRVAVVETASGVMPKQIHPRHTSVVRIVKAWERCNVGTTSRCAYEVALAEARELAAELNTAA